MNPVLSVCIVTRNRLRLLGQCLESLAAQQDPPEFELCVVADDDPEVPAVVRSHFPDAFVEVSNKSLPGASRNRLIEIASGDLLLFLDDDVVCDRSLLRRIADLAASNPDVGVFGGPNESALGSSAFQVVQGAVLASMATTGPVRRRYGRHPARLVDDTALMLCNLAIRHSIMLPFATDMVCAEENEVLTVLRSAGAKMLYDPGVLVYHERRPTFRAFVTQLFTYGHGRGQLIRREPSSIRPAFLLPSLLLVAMVPLVAAAIVATPWALVPLGFYAALVAASAAKIGVTVGHPARAPLAAALTIVVHACYGAGVIRGLLHPPARRRKRTEIVSAPAEASE